MKINPITKELFTDDGELIKRLHCPHSLRWDEQIDVDGRSSNAICAHCEHEIIDTKGYGDRELLHVVMNKEKCCLKLDLEQENIKVIIQ
ncbi:MAG: hypothetical protein ACOYNS_07060 [Bacteroidota bacterium]